MKLEEFFEHLEHVAKFSSGKWFVGSIRNECSKDVIRCFYNENELQFVPVDHKTGLVDTREIKPHWREICPVEAVANLVGFLPDRRPQFPQRSYTIFELVWRLGLEEKDGHRLFRAIDSDCQPAVDQNIALDYEVRVQLLNILRPRRYGRKQG